MILWEEPIAKVTEPTQLPTFARGKLCRHGRGILDPPWLVDGAFTSTAMRPYGGAKLHIDGGAHGGFPAGRRNLVPGLQLLPA